jgi:hypothetical protein
MSRANGCERRQTLRIARALQVAFRIPPGRELVGVLGSGVEHDNLEALACWVERRLVDPDARLAETVLPHLADDLEHTLLRWEAESRWVN